MEVVAYVDGLHKQTPPKLLTLKQKQKNLFLAQMVLSQNKQGG